MSSEPIDDQPLRIGYIGVHLTRDTKTAYARFVGKLRKRGKDPVGNILEPGDCVLYEPSNRHFIKAEVIPSSDPSNAMVRIKLLERYEDDYGKHETGEEKLVYPGHLYLTREISPQKFDRLLDEWFKKLNAERRDPYTREYWNAYGYGILQGIGAMPVMKTDG